MRRHFIGAALAALTISPSPSLAETPLCFGMADLVSVLTERHGETMRLELGTEGPVTFQVWVSDEATWTIVRVVSGIGCVVAVGEGALDGDLVRHLHLGTEA